MEKWQHSWIFDLTTEVSLSGASAWRTGSHIGISGWSAIRKDHNDHKRELWKPLCMDTGTLPRPECGQMDKVLCLP